MDSEDQTEIQVLQMEVVNIDTKMESIGQQVDALLAKQEKLDKQKKEILKKLKDLQRQSVHPAVENGDWNSDSFPWSAELKQKMIDHFHISNFRPLQKETMNVILSNKDCILIMPTGGGKSLSFQLPALISPGFTLVISPLVSLMEDQLIALRKLGINAMMLSASTGTSHNSTVLSKMVDKPTDMKILYVTPERLAKSKRFMSKLDKAYSLGNVSRIVIDEVHCASTWGNDFRPDYKMLCILKRQYAKVPLLGLTATASAKVLADIKDILGLDKCVVFRSSFNRPNLYYEVYKTAADQKALVADIAKRIKLEFKEMSGIVYCFSRKDSEEVASGLVKHGITAHCYHADIPADLKTKVHEGWINGHVQVVVATVAFGMGIDKPNVRFVFHFSISKSMENYYQESGRAGRDDQKSWCILYFRFQDIWRQTAMVFTEKTGLQNLHDMLRYVVDHRKCRRTLIGKHFAELWKASDCNKMCDNCQRDPDVLGQRSLNKEARELIDILESASYREERLTPIKLIDIWLGKCKVKDRPKEICPLPRDECEDILTKLLIDQILAEDFHFTPYNTITYVVSGSRWPLLKHGKIDVRIDALKKTKTTSKSKRDDKTKLGCIVAKEGDERSESTNINTLKPKIHKKNIQDTGKSKNSLVCIEVASDSDSESVASCGLVLENVKVEQKDMSTNQRIEDSSQSCTSEKGDLDVPTTKNKSMFCKNDTKKQSNKPERIAKDSVSSDSSESDKSRSKSKIVPTAKNKSDVCKNAAKKQSNKQERIAQDSVSSVSSDSSSSESDASKSESKSISITSKRIKSSEEKKTGADDKKTLVKGVKRKYVIDDSD